MSKAEQDQANTASLRTHSEFSPSKAHRFMNCTASHNLEKQYPDSYSDAAREGSRAHALAEHCLRCVIDPAEFKGGFIIEHDKGENQTSYELVKGPISNDKYSKHFGITDEMIEAISIYYNYIRAKSTGYSVEEKIDIIPNGCYGTADCVFIRNTTLYVIDFKYGAGVGVSASDNEQLKCYAFGIVKDNTNIRRAKLIIIQPRYRGGRIDESIISREDLIDFGFALANTLDSINKGNVEFEIGDHCKFCKAQGDCPEKSKTYLKDFADRDSLQIEDILAKIPEIREWLKAVEDSAFNRLRSGKAVPGWKLVDKQARSKIVNEKEAIEQLESLGYEVTEKSLLALGKLKKIVPDEILSPYIVKESSGQILAKDNDPRSETDLAKEF